MSSLANLNGQNRVAENQCGGCTACCVVYCLPELNKPAHTPCKHLCEARCSIYPQRPKVCADFLCGYMLYPWAPELRPDRCGIIFVKECSVRTKRVPRGLCVQLKHCGVDDDSPKLWTGNCLTTETFRNPPEAVQKFIYWQNRKGGIVVLTYDGQGTVEIKVFTPKGISFNEAMYLAYRKRAWGDQLAAVHEFLRTHQNQQSAT